MTPNEFQIEFAYDGVAYLGLVRPVGEGYSVSLESENQETFLDILLKPSSSELEDWDFECGEGGDAAEHYDVTLLEEIGEQIEEKLNKRDAGFRTEEEA